MDDWLNAKTTPPTKDGRYKVLLDGIGVRRYADFDAQRRAWNIDGQVVSWKNLEELVIDDLPYVGEDSFTVVELDDMDNEMLGLVAATHSEMKRTIGNVNIEITVATVNEDADTFITGKVLAVSEHYASQLVSDTSMVVHETSRLSARPMPGQEITIRYRDGLGEVMEDLSAQCVVKISSPDLLHDEAREIEKILRKIIIDVAGHRTDWKGLCTMIDIMPDNIMQGMAHKALKQASEALGWEELPESVSITRTQLATEQRAEMDRAILGRTEVTELRLPRSHRL